MNTSTYLLVFLVLLQKMTKLRVTMPAVLNSFIHISHQYLLLWRPEWHFNIVLHINYNIIDTLIT